MKETIWIDREVEEVWDFVELEFAKIFKCSPKKLSEKTLTIKRGNKEICQSIKVQDKPHRLVLLSEDDTDLVETHYTFIDDNEGSFVSLHELGKGKKNILRTLYYKAQDLPILRSKRKKKLRDRLYSIKYLLETDNPEDN